MGGAAAFIGADLWELGTKVDIWSGTFVRWKAVIKVVQQGGSPLDNGRYDGEVKSVLYLVLGEAHRSCWQQQNEGS